MLLAGDRLALRAHLAVKPHFILPFLGLTCFDVLCVIVVDEMKVLDVIVEGSFVETHVDSVSRIGCWVKLMHCAYLSALYMI